MREFLRAIAAGFLVAAALCTIISTDEAAIAYALIGILAALLSAHFEPPQEASDE